MMSDLGVPNIYFLPEVNMPRRSEVDRLKGDIDSMGFGPVRKDWSVEARAERRQRRNASKEVNMAKYRARRLAMGQPRRNP